MYPQMSANYGTNETVNQINTQSINLNLVSELANLQKVKIIQDVEFIDCCCPTCTSNKYSIIDPTTDEKLFDFKENGSCPERCCCFSCRGFTMKINNLGGNNIHNTYDGEKECSLPCLLGNGCGQPSIKVTLTAPNHKFLGSVKMDYESCCCSICSHKIVIRDEKKNVRYHIQRTTYCIGCYLTFCRCIPKVCDILYHIYDGNQVVGEVKKLKCSTCYTFCPKGDNYEIGFPPNASPEEKLLIIIGVILLDYLSFFI
jgi:hypothetical protein